MECIKKFLNDSYQSKLRHMAQSRSERYEDTIEHYKQIFLAHLNLVTKECPEGCVDNIICEEIRDVINEIQPKEIEDFFDNLKEIYLFWIDSKPIKAINLFKKLMKSKDLLRFKKAISPYDLYFKGRISDEVLTSWDMFHIPFNKRYLIQNQRYSLTGQPMLYIGGSVIDIAEEIEAENVDKLKLSLVTFIDNNFRIFDLRNNINEITDDIWLEKFLDIRSEKVYDKSTFFKMILSSVCSFQKRQELKGFSFCEEYVLPQLLAQILKNEKYDGIAYYSTKYYEQISNKNDMHVNIEFKENLAIFTKLNMKHVYDRVLYNKLFISAPIDKYKIYYVTMNDLNEINEEINQSGNQEKITNAERILSSFERIYGKMEINGVSYVDTEYGKLHMYELYTMLNRILVE